MFYHIFTNLSNVTKQAIHDYDIIIKTLFDILPSLCYNNHKTKLIGEKNEP